MVVDLNTSLVNAVAEFCAKGENLVTVLVVNPQLKLNNT